MKQRFHVFSVVFFLMLFAGCADINKSAYKNKQRRLMVDAKARSGVSSDSTKKKQELITPSPYILKLATQKKDEQIVPQAVQLDLSLSERVIELEARLGDMPVPVIVQLVEIIENNKGGYILTYHTELTYEELIQFYSSEITKLGWTCTAFFEQPELLFSFKRQKQTCIIVVRKTASRWWEKSVTVLQLYLQTS